MEIRQGEPMVHPPGRNWTLRLLGNFGLTALIRHAAFAWDGECPLLRLDWDLEMENRRARPVGKRVATGMLSGHEGALHETGTDTR